MPDSTKVILKDFDIVKVLKDKDRDVRWVAAWALGEIGDQAAVPALSKALKDKHETVRDAAAEALKKLEGKK